MLLAACDVHVPEPGPDATPRPSVECREACKAECLAEPRPPDIGACYDACTDECEADE